jgi:hypothetical protein
LCILIGSGAESFQLKAAELNGKPGGVLDILAGIVEDDSRKDVGGFLQFGMCSPKGYKNIPIVQRSPNGGPLEVNFLGYDVSKYKSIISFDVGYYAIALE